MDPPIVATTTVASVTPNWRRRGSAGWVPRYAWSSQIAPISSVPRREMTHAQPEHDARHRSKAQVWRDERDRGGAD